MKKIPCEVYSRVVGYFRPVQNWNKGKMEEFKDRQPFHESMSLNHSFAEKVEAKVEAPQQSVAETITADPVSYKIFTLPTCCKCKDAKEHLSNTTLQGAAYDLSTDEGRGALRGYFNDIKDRIQRLDDGSLPVPIMLFFDNENNIVNIATGKDELPQFTARTVAA